MNKNELLKKNLFLQILSSIFIFLIIIACTLYIFAYSYGYRIKLDRDNPFEETGVLSIESSPFQANIFVNNEEIGKTPKTVGSLIEGEYLVKVEKEGYKPWQKELTIKGQLSTPYSAFLFLNEPKYDTEINRDIVTKTTYVNNDNQVFLPYITAEVNSTTNVTTYYYVIETYKINKEFWDFSANPIIIFKAIYNTGDTYKMLPTDNGEFVLVYKYSANSTKVLESYVIKTSGIITPDRFEKNPLDSFYSGYTISWAKSNKHLMLESNTEILSYNISTKSIVILLKKDQNNPKVLWNTDELGNFYYGENAQVVDPSNELVNGKNYYKITRKELDGTNTLVIIDDIFYTSDTKGIEDLTALDKIPFTNSPFSTRFCGKVKNFEFQPLNDGAILTTEFGIYWYDLKTLKYSFIDKGNIEQIGFNTISDRFLFINTDTDTLNSYTVKVENSDHVNSIGNKIILSDISKLKTTFKWLNNSYYIAYTVNNTVHVIDFDGDNNQDVITHDSTNAFLFDSQVTYVYTVNTTEISVEETTTTKSLNSGHIVIKKWQVH